MNEMDLTPWDTLQPEESCALPPRRRDPGLLVSFLVSSRGRAELPLETLQRVEECGLAGEEVEVIITDRAGEGSAARPLERFALIGLMTPPKPSALLTRAAALAMAKGKYVVFLDDRSSPVPGSIERMVDYFEADDRLAAVVFSVTRPDGTREASSFPNVLIPGATGFRREALERVGGLPADCFRSGEEYELSLRLLEGGWKIEPFDDLHVAHHKPIEVPQPASAGSAVEERLTQLRVEKQLEVVTRYFPRRWVLPYANDWLRRQRLLARKRGHDFAYYSGLMKGLARALRPAARQPVNPRTFEALVRLEETQLRLQRAQDTHRFKQVLFLDLGKNMLAFWSAARACGLEVVGIADAELGGKGRRYRGMPLFSDEEARRQQFDAAIVCHVSPIWSAERRALWQEHDARPVIALFDSDDDSPSLPLFQETTSSRPAAKAIHRTVARSA